MNKFNELMYINFVELSKDGMCLITQRETNRLLRESVKYLNPKLESKDATYFSNGDNCIVRYSDLSVNSKVLH